MRGRGGARGAHLPASRGQLAAAVQHEDRNKKKKGGGGGDEEEERGRKRKKEINAKVRQQIERQKKEKKKVVGRAESSCGPRTVEGRALLNWNTARGIRDDEVNVLRGLSWSSAEVVYRGRVLLGETGERTKKKKQSRPGRARRLERGARRC